MRLWVERFNPWIKVLVRKGWTPNSPPPAPQVEKKPVVEEGASLRPWMVAACGGAGNDAYVLAWLLRILGNDAGPFDRAFRRIRPDGMWVAFRQKTLARELGLSISQVKRAILSLKQKGFIDTEPGSDGGFATLTFVRVNETAIEKAMAKFKKKQGK